MERSRGHARVPSHNGIPAITLDHGQAYYAQGNRVGVYPLVPAFYAGNDSVVLWSDSMKSVAVKANNWAINLQLAPADLAAALNAHLAPPRPSPAPGHMLYANGTAVVPPYTLEYK